ncbi:uncharacterized protein [Halyomorpha halys]|uniref:uncharacterized protein n=1 Tax=Halyomorpha halys TaxID=286706 RepID=UPI0006D51FC7|nr:serine/arginine-rich splicing factor RS2Z32-like [Halyomorpha halys]
MLMIEDGTEYRTTAQGIRQHHGREEPRDSGKDRGTGREGRPNQGRVRNGGGKEDRKCHGCGKVGHLVAQCPRTRCFECGNEGQIARQCPYMYRRAETEPGEPMEILQRIRRRRRKEYRRSESSSETSEATEASGTEGRRKRREEEISVSRASNGRKQTDRCDP